MPSSLDIFQTEPVRQKPIVRPEKAEPRPDGERDFAETLVDTASEQPSTVDVASDPVDAAAVDTAAVETVGATEALTSPVTAPALDISPQIQLSQRQLGPVAVTGASQAVAASVPGAGQQPVSPLISAQATVATAERGQAAAQMIAPRDGAANSPAANSSALAPASTPIQMAQIVQSAAPVQAAAAREPEIVLPPVLKSARIDLAAKAQSSSTAVTGGTANALQANPASRIGAALSTSNQTLTLAGDSALSFDAGARLAPQTAALAQPNAQVFDPQVMLNNAATQTTSETPATQTAPQVQSALSTSAASQTQAPQLAQAMAQPAAQQLSMSIIRGAREGTDRIEVQLHPAELGRVEVKLELGHDGRIMAVISADKSETLEHLRRDVQQLERALADAGFDADRDSFQFRDGDAQQHAQSGSGGAEDDLSDDIAEAAVPTAIANRMIRLDGLGLDIRV